MFRVERGCQARLRSTTILRLLQIAYINIDDSSAAATQMICLELSAAAKLLISRQFRLRALLPLGHGALSYVQLSFFPSIDQQLRVRPLL